MIISLTGFMGCGKSSTGRALAARLGAHFVDLDEVIVARAGRSIPEIFREGGEAAFRQLELETLRAVLDGAGNTLTVFALGGGALTQSAARSNTHNLCKGRRSIVPLPHTRPGSLCSW